MCRWCRARQPPSDRPQPGARVGTGQHLPDHPPGGHTVDCIGPTADTGAGGRAHRAAAVVAFRGDPLAGHGADDDPAGRTSPGYFRRLSDHCCDPLTLSSAIAVLPRRWRTDQRLGPARFAPRGLRAPPPRTRSQITPPPFCCRARTRCRRATKPSPPSSPGATAQTPHRVPFATATPAHQRSCVLLPQIARKHTRRYLSN